MKQFCPFRPVARNYHNQRMSNTPVDGFDTFGNSRLANGEDAFRHCCEELSGQAGRRIKSEKREKSEPGGEEGVKKNNEKPTPRHHR